MVSQTLLDRHEKEVLLLDKIDAWKELVTAFKKILAAVYTLMEDLPFFLIQLVAYIYL